MKFNLYHKESGIGIPGRVTGNANKFPFILFLLSYVLGAQTGCTFPDETPFSITSGQEVCDRYGDFDPNYYDETDPQYKTCKNIKAEQEDYQAGKDPGQNGTDGETPDNTHFVTPAFVAAGAYVTCATGYMDDNFTELETICWGDESTGLDGRTIANNTFSPIWLDWGNIPTALACQYKNNNFVCEGSPSPVPVESLELVYPRDFSITRGPGGLTTCVVTANSGTGDPVVCQGESNEVTGNTPTSWPGDDVPDAGGPFAIAVGNDFACALSDNGSKFGGYIGGIYILSEDLPGVVDCWGAIGPLPDAIDAINTAIEIESDGNYICVVFGDRTKISCWGPYLNGEARSLYQGGSGIYGLSLNSGKACWIEKNDGDIFTAGQLKCADLPESTPALGNPSEDLLEKRYRSVSVGYTHACAISDEDSIECWGTNDFGETSVP